MKPKAIIAILAVFVMIVAAVSISAADVQNSHPKNCKNGNFVDANGDGICDNNKNWNFTDANGDGICDNCNDNCKQLGFQKNTSSKVCKYNGACPCRNK